MAKILVTGGTGFIGGELVRRLLREGHEVRVMARSPASPLALRLESIGAEIVPGDLVEASSLPRVVDGCEGLFHLAAWFEIGTRDRASMYAINVEGTESLLAACRASDMGRIVHVSTILALGPTRTECRPALPPSIDILEGPPREDFSGPFEETKYLAQRIALMHARQGAHIVIVCPGTVIGREDPSELGTALRLSMRGRLPFMTGGSSCFSFVGLRDAVEGLILAYEHGKPGVVYPLVSEVCTLEELSRLSAQAAGVSPPRWDLPRWMTWLGLPVVNLLGRLSSGRRIYSREALAVLARNWGYDAGVSREELGWDCSPLADVLEEIAANLQAPSSQVSG